MFRHLVLAVAASAALAGASPATATSSASATLTQFGYTLVDLNPSDGVEPAVVFPVSTSPWGGALFHTYVETIATDMTVGSDKVSNWSLLTFGPASASAARGLARSQAEVAGSAASHSLSVHASGASLGASFSPLGQSPRLNSQFGAFATVGTSPASIPFVLSPHTKLIFSGQANLQATTTVGAFGPDDYYPPWQEYANAEVWLQTSSIAESGGSVSQVAVDGRSLYATYLTYGATFDPVTGLSPYQYDGESLSLGPEMLSVAFTNDTADALVGTLDVYSAVSGISPFAPVPETGTGWMMLAGLAGLVCIRPRRLWRG